MVGTFFRKDRHLLHTPHPMHFGALIQNGEKSKINTRPADSLLVSDPSEE